MVDPLQVQSVGPADHQAQVAPVTAPVLDEAAELEAVELLALAIQQRDEGSRRQAPVHLFVLAQLDQLKPDVARNQALVVLNVVDVGRSQASHRDDDESHPCDTRSPMNGEDQTPERHINIHFSPEIMAGTYANFANVSHSDYEFTITFARVDHEVEAEEIPGVVVSRINLSARFMRELIDAMQDNYSKWETREGIKNLPEFGPGPGEDEEEE